MIERTFIEQGIKRIELEEFLKGELGKAGFTKLEIVKTPLVTRIVVNVTMPGIAIGKSGQNIRQLTETIDKKFGIDNPQLEIREIESPNLDAAAVANKLKALIERGFSWRSVAYRTVKDIMDAGAQGVELLLSGKLAGKGGRKRKQRIAYGYMKKVGDQTKLVNYAKASAYPKAGAIGIKVRIVRPETIFPDKINLKELWKEKEEAEKEGERVEEKEKGKEEGAAKEKAEKKKKGEEEVKEKKTAEKGKETEGAKGVEKGKKKEKVEEKKGKRRKVEIKKKVGE